MDSSQEKRVMGNQQKYEQLKIIVMGMEQTIGAYLEFIVLFNDVFSVSQTVQRRMKG